MIPSRGIHALRATVPRHSLLQQCRHLSSTPRPNVRSPLLPRTGWSKRTTAPTNPFLSKLASVRYASSETSAQHVPPPSEFPNLDTIHLDNLNSAVSSATHLPGEVGYLQSLGIDYGFGPTSLVQYVLENIHAHSGMPWWGTILTTALLLRLAAFPLFLRASDSSARQTALAPILKPILEAQTAAQKAGDTQGVLYANRQRMAINKKAGISFTAQLTPIMIQSVLGFCGFRLMKAMVALPVPGFLDGGFLWLTDLTLTDGYLILPILMAGTMHLIARLGGESGAAQLPPQFKNVMLYGLPVIIALFTAFQPGAVCLWFCGSGVIGLAQGQLLQRPAVRRFFNLAPIYKPKPGEEMPNPLLAMLGQAEKKSKSSTTTSGAAARGTGQRPGVAYMNPQYQAPNVQRSQGRTIDVAAQPSRASSDMVQPGQKSTSNGGMFSGITESVQSFRSKVAEATKVDPEKKRAQERDAFKRRAEAYEKRARGRGG